MKIILDYDDQQVMLEQLKIVERAILEGIEYKDLWGYWNAETGISHSVKRNKDSIRIQRNSSSVGLT